LSGNLKGSKRAEKKKTGPLSLSGVGEEKGSPGEKRLSAKREVDRERVLMRGEANAPHVEGTRAAAKEGGNKGHKALGHIRYKN